MFCWRRMRSQKLLKLIGWKEEIFIGYSDIFLKSQVFLISLRAVTYPSRKESFGNLRSFIFRLNNRKMDFHQIIHQIIILESLWVIVFWESLGNSKKTMGSQILFILYLSCLLSYSILSFLYHLALFSSNLIVIIQRQSLSTFGGCFFYLF